MLRYGLATSPPISLRTRIRETHWRVALHLLSPRNAHKNRFLIVPWPTQNGAAQRERKKVKGKGGAVLGNLETIPSPPRVQASFYVNQKDFLPLCLLYVDRFAKKQESSLTRVNDQLFASSWQALPRTCRKPTVRCHMSSPRSTRSLHSLLWN